MTDSALSSAPPRAGGRDLPPEMRDALDVFKKRCKTLRFLRNNLIGAGGLPPESPLALLLEAVTDDSAALESAIADALGTAKAGGERAEAEVITLMEDIGGRLANCAFNLAQKRELDERTCATLDEVRVKWDATLYQHRATVNAAMDRLHRAARPTPEREQESQP